MVYCGVLFSGPYVPSINQNGIAVIAREFACRTWPCGGAAGESLGSSIDFGYYLVIKCKYG